MLVNEQKLRVMFLGGGRLVELGGHFKRAASTLGVDLELTSVDDANPWHAFQVSGMGRSISGPKFLADNFETWLAQCVVGNQVDIVIPCTDAATIALARAARRLRENDVLPIVSSVEICESMADKRLSDEIFRCCGLKVPEGEHFPALAKPRFGASARGIVRLNDLEELNFWRRRNPSDQYIVQPFITGTEYSVDAYVDQTGRTLGIVSRQRVIVSDGEVMVTRTQRQKEAIETTQRLLKWGQWYGPLTVQVIDDGVNTWLLECNPRFGSGVTCSIAAGLAIPEWILRERLGLPLPERAITWADGLCVTRSRKDHILWSS